MVRPRSEGSSFPRAEPLFLSRANFRPGTNNLTASYSGDAVLTPSVSAPMAEVVSDYILQVIPATVAVKQGNSASVTLNLIPQGGFTNPVQLACSNLPADVTCKFNKSTITLDGRILSPRR